MTLLHACLLGLLEGLTEFIPVSSTAHMLIAQNLFSIPSSNTVFAFLVLVQLGALVALIIYFRNDLWSLALAFFDRPFSTPENKLAWYILMATVPALLVGVLLKSTVEALFQNPSLEAAIRLFAAAILLSLAEWLGKRMRNLDKMNWLDALIIGFFQVLAIFPGSSRSASAIGGGMLRNFDRPSATRFAFLMSVPVMLAAGGYESLSVFNIPGLHALLVPLIIGWIVAGIVGWLSIRWLINYVSRHSLYVFAAYCAILALGLISFTAW